MGKMMSFGAVVRRILSFAVPPIVLPAAVALSNINVGFTDDASRELVIYYFIGLVWLALSVGIWRATGLVRPGLQTAPSFIAVGFVCFEALVGWCLLWSDQNTDFHPGLGTQLHEALLMGLIGVGPATLYVLIAGVPFRAKRR